MFTQPDYLYEHLIFLSLLVSIYVFLRAFFSESRSTNRHLVLLLLCVTGFNAASFISMMSPTAYWAEFWFVQVRTTFLFLTFLISAWLIIQTLKIQREPLTLPAMTMLIISIVIGITCALIPSLQPLMYAAISFHMHNGIWMRESMHVGPVYTVLFLLEITSLILFFYSRRRWFFKLFVQKNASMHERKGLIFLILVTLPQLYGALMANIQSGMFGHYNLMPVVQTAIGMTAYFFIFNNYYYSHPRAKEWIFNNLPDPVLIFSKQNELLDANPAAIKIGRQYLQHQPGPYAMEEQFGRHITEIYPKNGGVVEEHLNNLPLHYQAQITTPNGKPLTFDASIIALKNPAGKTTAKILHLHDISHQARLKAILQEERALSAWLDTQFAKISLKLDPSKALQRALGILAELSPFDSAEIFILKETGMIKAAALDLSSEKPGPATLVETGTEKHTLIHAGQPIGLLTLRYGEPLPAKSSANQRNIQAFSSRLVNLLLDLLDMEAKQARAREVERQLFAQDMHDSVTQTLHAAQMVMQVVMKSRDEVPPQVGHSLLNLNQQINGALQEMRTMLFEMRPATMSSKSLAEMIQSLLDANRTRTHIHLQLDAGDIHEPDMLVKLGIYRIVQEALNLAMRHTSPDYFRVSLGRDIPGNLWVYIDDDGIPPNPAEAIHHAHSLEIIRTHAGVIQAGLKLDAFPGPGTHIEICCPKNANNDSK